MMKTIKSTQVTFILTIAFVVLSIGGCALSNEGATDYRRAEPPPAALMKAFRTAVDGHTAQAGEPKIISPLLRKDVESSDPDARIVKNDKISIRLRDGYLRYCNEFWRNPMRRVSKNCEIAILFRAFELGEGQDFNFKPGAEREARLVYFSHDVQEGQHFNLHNMPVYGPIAYNGRPIGIDIFIIEIDAEDKQAFALLKSLASVGAKAFAPSSPLLNVLDGLGSSLLSSGTDDIEFRYSFVLDPASGYKGTVFATVEAGDYVLIRNERRQATMDWSNLFLDHNTGRVWLNQSEKLEPYREQTYLTVQVLKNAGADDVSLSQNLYGGFRDAIEKDSTEKVEKLAPLIGKLNDLAHERVQIRNFNQAQQQIERMASACDISKQSDGNATVAWQQSAYDLFNQVRDSVIKLGNCDAMTQPPRSDLSADQVNYVLLRLRERAKIVEPIELNMYQNSCNGFAKLTIDQFTPKMCQQ